MISTIGAAAAIQSLYGMSVVQQQHVAKMGVEGMEVSTGMASYSLGRVAPLKPCAYCGRTNQNRAHDNCDGCGAPKEAQRG